MEDSTLKEIKLMITADVQLNRDRNLKLDTIIKLLKEINGNTRRD